MVLGESGAGKFIVPCKVLYSFTLIRIGSTATMVIIKVVHSAPMIVANFIDRYLPGILAVSMNRLLYLVPFGRITGAYSSYSSSHRPDLPSLLTPPLEPFPSFSQSLTLSNIAPLNTSWIVYSIPNNGPSKELKNIQAYNRSLYWRTRKWWN